MMKWLKLFLKFVLILISLPLLYALISLIISYIPVNQQAENLDKPHSIYLHTNGIHLDIALKKEDVDANLFPNIYSKENEKIISFGWGDENFYLNTPTWGDLTFENGFKAIFLKSSSLMHVTRYQIPDSDWIEIPVTKEQWDLVKQHLAESFTKNDLNQFQMLQGAGYTETDDFYNAKNSYHMFNTCNSWVNGVFKKSGIKACLWTPFDFGLMDLHENEYE